MFKKILIANRGEIACRIIETCRRMGVQTVAVYSEADAGARHVRMADQAHCIGPAASSESYLRGERILDVVKQTGAEAVHPGYGFLSENESFAKACADAGVVFIGPPTSAIHAMGSKSAAKALMTDAGVPLVPGYHGDEQATEHLKQQAQAIGFPVMIKATAGGGGKGMRVVERAEDFEASLASCQRESRSSFGDDRVLIERYLQRPRHVEIQIFGDSHGDVIYLHERDCSAQRRHQKVVEEAPAPGMTEERRAAMGQAACQAARAVNYVGAGTVEFIVDSDDAFYFMEMNTRLQVEHPVTEMITGLDLVEWQLRIASGQSLPLTQSEVPLNGHSIEVRVYAEEPEKGFLPSIGQLRHYRPPSLSANVRIDTGIDQGDEISPHYDPMIAKLIVWDATREQAIERMLAALGQFQIVGVGNNIAFLSRLVGHPEFRSGSVDTGLIARESDALLASQEELPEAALYAATLWWNFQNQLSTHRCTTNDGEPDSPWSQADGWRLNTGLSSTVSWLWGEAERVVSLDYIDGGIQLDNKAIEQLEIDASHVRFQRAGSTFKATVLADQGRINVFLDNRHWIVSRHDPLAAADQEQDSHGGMTAPMPGKILSHLTEAGSSVKKGDPILMMEAMKMEHTVTAPSDGTVKSFCAAVGEQVAEGTELVEFEPAD
tara:strand:- start:1544 stop:3532 length:1989 start_codon:yes stop_codon:yes gene_type:complete